MRCSLASLYVCICHLKKVFLPLNCYFLIHKFDAVIQQTFFQVCFQYLLAGNLLNSWSTLTSNRSSICTYIGNLVKGPCPFSKDPAKQRQKEEMQGRCHKCAGHGDVSGIQAKQHDRVGTQKADAHVQMQLPQGHGARVLLIPVEGPLIVDV